MGCSDYLGCQQGCCSGAGQPQQENSYIGKNPDDEDEYKYM